MKRFTEKVDGNTRAYFACLSTGRWLAFRLHVVVIIMLTASCFFSVAVNEYSGALGERVARAPTEVEQFVRTNVKPI